MSVGNSDVQERIQQYLAKAHQVLSTGWLALEHHDYITAVNRAYHTILYAANALLTTKGLERSKHSGVLAAFREQFVKTEIIEPEYSDFYGATMDARADGDYAVGVFLERDTAERALSRAKRFVARIERALEEMGDQP